MNLLQGKKWAQSVQIKLSIATVILFPIFLFEGVVGFFVIIINVLILITFSRNKKVKIFFGSTQDRLPTSRRAKIIFFAIIYLLTSVLFLHSQYSQSESETADDMISRMLPNQEMVMTKGMEITAETPDGTIKIFADDLLTRTYTWGNCTRTQVLSPRQERWFGVLGASFSGRNRYSGAAFFTN